MTAYCLSSGYINIKLQNKITRLESLIHLQIPEDENGTAMRQFTRN